MAHILLVDDEPNVVEFTRDRLVKEGFTVAAAGSGEEALACLSKDNFDLLILDIMLPGMDGFEVCRELRRAGNAIPIILLTAKVDDVDKIVGLELGADDYVVKPFNPRELVARVRAVLRRLTEVRELRARMPQPPEGPLHVDPQRREASINGVVLDLRPREFELLAFLARHPGQVFTREALLRHIWGYDSYADVRTVDVHIRRLRGKISALAPKAKLIHTEWGVGYKYAE